MDMQDPCKTDARALHVQCSASASPSASPEVIQRPNFPPPERDHEADFNRLYVNHPQAQRKYRGLAMTTYAQSVGGGADPNMIARVHSAMCATETWRWKSGVQAPTLAQWLVDHGWEFPPDGFVEATPPQSAPIDTQTDEEFFDDCVRQLMAVGDSRAEARETAGAWLRNRQAERKASKQETGATA
jgi:hypothetical protein